MAQVNCVIAAMLLVIGTKRALRQRNVAPSAL